MTSHRFDTPVSCDCAGSEAFLPGTGPASAELAFGSPPGSAPGRSSPALGLHQARFQYLEYVALETKVEALDEKLC